MTVHPPFKTGRARLMASSLPLTALRNLQRHRGRTALSLAGIAVTAAMLLDMVLLSGGIERSFERLLLGRGFQIRISPQGTLPFDTEASIPESGRLEQRIRAVPGVEVVAPMLGGSLHALRGDSLVTLFGYGVEPDAQSLYELESGADLMPGDTTGLLLSGPASRLTGARPGDTVAILGRLDPQLMAARVERHLVARGTARWLYDYRGQPSVGIPLPVMQALQLERAEERVSAFAVRLHEGVDVDSVVRVLRREVPEVEVTSVAALVAGFRERLVYFRQLSYILATISLIIAFLLLSTLLTITVNERLGEIATIRAIGTSRGRVAAQIIFEGAFLTILGGGVGAMLGMATARYLDRILTSFPGLPATISFFVPDPSRLAAAAAVLLLTGSLAGGFPAYRAASLSIAQALRMEAP